MINTVQIIEHSTTRNAVIDLESKLLQNNIIFINEVFEAETVSKWQAEIIYLTSKMSAKDSEKTPIKLYINSPGGDVTSLLGLYDVIQLYVNKGYIIETYNVGEAASAAGIILLSGSAGHRFALPNATTMLHSIQAWHHGSLPDITIESKEVSRLQEVLEGIMVKHTQHPELIDFIKRNAYFNAEDALKYGIIDKIQS